MSTLRDRPVIIKGSNSEIIAALEQNKDAREFLIKRKVSNRILYLMFEITKVKKIILSTKIAAQLPKNSINAIRKIGVEVKVLQRVKRGRKRKYDVKFMKGLVGKGKVRIKKISERKKIPLRTLYFYKNKFSERARK